MQKKKMVYYVIGSILVFGMACMIVPKLSKKITNKVYRISLKKRKSEENWGPELVKKDTPQLEESNVYGD